MPVRCAVSCVVLVVLGCERIEVTAVRVDRGPVESTVTSVEAGVVEPLRKASLASPVSGRIVRVHKAEGDRVAAGEAIVELENDIEKLRVEETASDLRRLRDLKDVDASEARIELAEFAHRRAKVEYERTFIRATFPGVIAELNARVGEMTFGAMGGFSLAGKSPAESRFVYVVDDSKLFVEAQVDESDVFRLRPGQPARVTLGGIERRSVEGRLISISPAVSTQEGESRTAKVKVELFLGPYAPPEDGGSRAPRAPYEERGEPPYIAVGMSADLEVLVGRAEEVTRVPTPAVLERGNEKYVFVVADGRLSRRTIAVGIGNWDMTEVREGLAPAQLVVLPTDTSALRDGKAAEAVIDESRRAFR
ncbi:MAG: HlyD family efflux transporter periplasmic adaptor subunit [Planctomycetes bacterium]|nr:HlyD family efflux transporter periplasmic adaptor subunit [Planctomycetota bacterium]